MSKKIEERKIMILAPMLLQLPDKLAFTFEVGEDGIAKFSYEEEFPTKDLVKKTLDMIKRMYDIPGIKVWQEGLKVLVRGELPPPMAVGSVLSEVLAQAVYYLGKEKIRQLLDVFPMESDYVSRGKVAEAIKIMPKEETLTMTAKEKVEKHGHSDG